MFWISSEPSARGEEFHYALGAVRPFETRASPIRLCRKRPFATHGQRPRPARAAVCRIPCRILCLADVERTSMARRPVLTSPAARRRPSPSSTVPLRPRASEPSHSAPAASHRFPGPCGQLPRNRLETPTPSLSHRRCGAGKFRHQRAPPTRWPQSASQLLVDPMTSWSAISAWYSMARRFMTRGTGRTQVSLLQ